MKRHSQNMANGLFKALLWGEGSEGLTLDSREKNGASTVDSSSDSRRLSCRPGVNVCGLHEASAGLPWPPSRR